MKNKKISQKGFTLIELVVVIGILAVLLTIVLIAINPGKQLEAANNTKRRSDVNAILNAVTQYAANNKGNLPSGIGGSDPASATAITNATGTTSICDSIVPLYIAALPIDPSVTGDQQTVCAAGGTTDTEYKIYKDAVTNRVTVLATKADPDISITR